MSRRGFRKYTVEADFLPFRAVGTVVVGDTQGDPDVPNGTRELEPYVDDLAVYVGEDEVTQWLNREAEDAIIDKIMSEGREL